MLASDLAAFRPLQHNNPTCLSSLASRAVVICLTKPYSCGQINLNAMKDLLEPDQLAIESITLLDTQPQLSRCSMILIIYRPPAEPIFRMLKKIIIDIDLILTALYVRQIHQLCRKNQLNHPKQVETQMLFN